MRRPSSSSSPFVVLVPLTTHLLIFRSQAVAFLASFVFKSVLLGLEVFVAGFVLLMLVRPLGITAALECSSSQAAVPPWPYLNRHPIKFLPVRSAREKS